MTIPINNQTDYGKTADNNLGDKTQQILNVDLSFWEASQPRLGVPDLLHHYSNQNLKEKIMTPTDLKHYLWKHKLFANVCGSIVGFIVALMAIVVVSAIGIGFSIMINRNLLNSNEQNALEAIRWFESNIYLEFTKNFGSLYTLTEAWHQNNYSMTEQRFDDLAGRLTVLFPLVNSFQYALGRNYTLSYIYPHSLDYLIGFQVTSRDPIDRLLPILECIAGRNISVFGPTSLAQGGIAFLAQTPIINRFTDEYIGISIEILYLDQIFSYMDLYDTLDQYEYELYQYDKNRIFGRKLKNDTVIRNVIDFNEQVGVLASDSVSLDINPMTRWKMFIRPKNGWSATNNILIETFVIIGCSAVISVCTFLIFWQITTSCLRAKEKDVINQQLEAHVMIRTRHLFEMNTKLENAFVKSLNDKEAMVSVLEMMGMGLLVTSIEGRILNCNSKMELLSGYSIDELKRMNLSQLIRHLDVEHILSDKSTAADELPSKIEIDREYIQSKTGNSFIVSLSLNFKQVDSETQCFIIVKKKKKENSGKASSLQTTMSTLSTSSQTHKSASSPSNKHQNNTFEVNSVDCEKFLADVKNKSAFKEFLIIRNLHLEIFMLEFLEQVEDFKSCQDEEKRLEKYNKIISIFLTPHSEMCILSEIIQFHLVNPQDMTSFDELCQVIKIQLCKTSFKSFKSSLHK